jgi:hypothetical protein
MGVVRFRLNRERESDLKLVSRLILYEESENVLACLIHGVWSMV